MRLRYFTIIFALIIDFTMIIEDIASCGLTLRSRIGKKDPCIP